MRRKLFNFASVASLVVFCVATALIGGISIWGDRSHRFLHVVGPWACSTSLGRMGMQVVVLHASSAPVIGPAVPGRVSSLTPQYIAFENQFPHYFGMRGPFGFEYGPMTTSRGNRLHALGTRTWVMFPFRLFGAVFLLLPAIQYLVLPIVGRINMARRRGGCAACAYNLTGNTSGVCPECGTVVAETSEVMG